MKQISQRIYVITCSPKTALAWGGTHGPKMLRGDTWQLSPASNARHKQRGFCCILAFHFNVLKMQLPSRGPHSRSSTREMYGANKRARDDLGDSPRFLNGNNRIQTGSKTGSLPLKTGWYYDSEMWQTQIKWHLQSQKGFAFPTTVFLGRNIESSRKENRAFLLNISLTLHPPKCQALFVLQIWRKICSKNTSLTVGHA